MARPHERERNELLANDPHCSMCGVEHGTGRDALHYHHTIPQHTGINEHVGCLLCRYCHQRWHAKERGRHKIIDDRGYQATTNNPYKPYKRQRAKRKKDIERLLSVYCN